MRKKFKGCLNIVVLILALVLFIDYAKAETHPRCTTEDCATVSVLSYICPNDGATEEDSISDCSNALIDGAGGLSAISTGDTVPLKYNESSSRASLIGSLFKIDPGEATDIDMAKVTFKYDPDQLEIVSIFWRASDFDGLEDFSTAGSYGCGLPAVNTKSSDGIVLGNLKPTEPILTCTRTEGTCSTNPKNDPLTCCRTSSKYKKDGTDGWASAQPPYTDETCGTLPGLIKMTLQPTGDIWFNSSDGDYTDPIYAYVVFKVKDDASGDITIEPYQPLDQPSPAYSIEYIQFSTDGGNQDYVAVTNASTFKVGSSVTIPKAITGINVYADSTKNKQYLFGTPGVDYSVNFNPESEETEYQLYLPSNTTSIYIDTSTAENGVASGDVGTKVLSVGTASFTIVGTIDGETQSYTITYHVPNNSLSNITSIGRWASPNNTFSPNILNYSIYLKPTEVTNLTISSTLMDSTGGIETAYDGTTLKAKSQVSSASDTIATITSGKKYTIKSYGAECFGDYYTALGECNYKTYEITYKEINRTMSSITVTGTKETDPTPNAVYGISSSVFEPYTMNYTVYIPAAESSVRYGAIPADTNVTADVSTRSKQLDDGNNNVKIEGVAKENPSEDTYKETYNINLYRISEDASADSFTVTDTSNNSIGSLSAFTDSTSGNVTTKSATLTLGASVDSVRFNINTKYDKAYVKTVEEGNVFSEDWDVNTTTPYEVTIYSESCKTDYNGVTNNVCKQTKYVITAVKLSDNDDIDSIFVADTASSSTPYTVADKGSNNYSVTIPSGKTAVYLAVTADDKTSPATVTYDSARNADTGMVQINSENTNVVVTITAQDTTVHTNYTITIHRASTNANLNLLSFSKGDFGSTYSTTSPVQNPTGKIEYDEAGITFNAQAEYATARLDNKDTGTRSYTDEPWTFTSDKTQTKTITVFSESCYTPGDDCTSKAYTITLNRLKTESKLATITVKKGSNNDIIKTYTITNDTDPTTYTFGIPSTETSAIVEVTKGDSTETVTFNSDTTESLSKTVDPLSTANDNTQTVHVTSEYGETYVKEYTINLHKVSDDTNLTFTSDKGVGTTPITAHPTDTNKYVLKILAGETSANITSTASSTAYINTEATGATKTEPWTFTSPTEYTVTVYPERCKAAYNNGTACTASDGVVYTLIRNAVSNDTKPNKIYVKSSDGSVTYGTIDFTGSTTPNMTVNVPVGTTEVKFEVETKSGQTASLPGTDGVVSDVEPGAKAYTVTITASDESTSLGYSVTIYAPHTDKDLTSISVASPAILDPSTIEAATDNHFTVKVSDQATSVSVSAESSATSYINAETNENTLINASWNVSGTNPSDFTIKIFPESCKAAYRTAECSDSDATIYTLSVQKLSSAKTISGVSVNDVPATWDSTESKWKVLLPSTATTATVTCTASAPTTCEGTTIAADDFHDGANTATVNITAEDQSQGTNTVEIYRVSNKIGISGISFSNGVLKESATPDGTYTYTGKFSDTKETTTVTPTPKYNGIIDGTLAAWDLKGDTVADYTFTIKSESCKDEYASIADIAATCATHAYTISYEAVSSSTTLGSISVVGQDSVDYFTDTLGASSYTVYVPSTVTSATVTVTPEVTGTTVNPATTTLSSLSEGANPTITVTVTPQDTSISASTYTITVYKLNNNALLKTLSASPNGTIGTLNDEVFNYDLTLTDGTVTTTNISAEAKYAKAKLYVNSSLSGTEKEITSQEWDLSNNTFTIKVKSESCDHQSSVITECEEKTYTITKKVLSNSVILDGLEVKPSDSGTAYTLKPAFSDTETNYSVDLPNGTTGAIILINPGSKGITISSQTIMTTGGTITKDSENKNKLTVAGLKTGDNTVTINILAEDNTTPGQYTVNLHVKNTSTEISLSADPGDITGTGTNLTLTVPNGTNTSTLTATIPSGATVKMNGTAKTPGSDSKVNDSWTFVDGDTYEIEVTPEEGTKVTYTVTVSVLPPEQSGDNSITSLTADPGTITGSGTNRTLTVPFGTTSTDISVTSATGSKVTMNGTAKNTNSGTETWSGFSHGDTFVINVEAENGDDQDYTITVNIQDPTDEDKDSSLKSITVTKSESVPAIVYSVFEPTFIPSQTGSESYSYTVFVPYETVYVDLDAEATNTSLLPTFSSQNGIALGVGDNQETISVTSADGSSTTVYNINIYRISNEARLDAFDIGASDLNETFDKDITDYTALISNQYPSTSVTYTLRYNKAFVTSETNTATSDTWNFNGGTNTEYTLHVYAESCKDKFKDVIGNTCVDNEYKITATFFNPKITSDTYGLTLTTTPSGEATIDIISDAVYKSTGADIKGEQTDNPSVQLKLYEKNETTEVADTAPLATGMVLKLIINNAEYDKRYIVVPGDTNGNAIVDIVDLGQVVDHILAFMSGSSDGILDGVYYVAGNVQADAEIDIADLGMVVDIILADMGS